jgi:hypothetical protein
MATTQAAHKKAVHELFDSLDRVEAVLTGKDYLVGDRLGAGTRHAVLKDEEKVTEGTKDLRRSC